MSILDRFAEKPIDEMTSLQINREIKRRINLVNINGFVDERTYAILDFCFQTNQREKNFVSNILRGLLQDIKPFEAKKQLLERYANQLSNDEVLSIQFLSNKIISVRVIDAGDSAEERLQKDKENAILIGVIYACNQEKIENLDLILENCCFETFYEIYNSFPDEEKYELLKRKMLLWNHRNLEYIEEKYLELFNSLSVKEKAGIMDYFYLNSLLREAYVKDVSVQEAVKKFSMTDGGLVRTDKNYREQIVFDESIRRCYAKDYLKNLYQPREEDKRKVNGITVYSPKNFNMFVHVIGAYSKFRLNNSWNKEKETSSLEIWKSSGDKTSHIMCTSYIQHNNLAYVKTKERKNLFSFMKGSDNIVLGFADVGENSVLMASASDIASVTTSLESQKANRDYTFRNSENMIRNTRGAHNEVAIERRLEHDKKQNILPSYVVCYDTISMESQKVAREMNVPIVYIDRNEIAKQESAKLNRMITRFKATKEPALLREIINQYEGNLVSFLESRKDLVRKYFNISRMNQTIEEILSELEAEFKTENRENAVKCYKVLESSFEDEIEKFAYSGFQDELISRRNIKIRLFYKRIKQHRISLEETEVESESENNEFMKIETMKKEARISDNQHQIRRKHPSRVKKERTNYDR